MTKQYNLEIVRDKEVIWYEENGVRYSFTADPVNSDYQAYLRWLENPNEVEHLTEIPPQAALSTPSV